ncbi:MAG: hypothetical protein K0Q47_19 [Sedimentibacter sp.]|jgi:hypothetical protein|nr:hypothetical protein [Sedimentibacter sp.]
MGLNVEYVCEKCGKPADEDLLKSNKNWKVYKTECICGGKIVAKADMEDDEMAQCTAKCKATGERCRRKAVEGYNVCTVHGAGTKKRVEQGIRKRPGAPITTGGRSQYMKKEVLDKVHDYQNDPDLEKLDWELAYLKTLPDRVENSDMLETDKILLLEKTLTSIFNNMDKREKIIEARRYSFGVEKLQLLIQYMFASVKKHVSDPNVLIAIAKDLREIAGQTNNIDGNSAGFPTIE